MSYSGPTYIAIRSAKHDSSTAATHGADFEVLVDDPLFSPFARTESGAMKPIVIITVDGGPDENPRFQKPLSVAAHHFTKNNLDFLVIATHAPGNEPNCDRTAIA